MEEEKLNNFIKKAKEIYTRRPEIWCPYFSSYITLNSEGFNHLLYKPNRLPRNIDEQILKLSLIKKAIEVINKAGTLQEYRETIEKYENKSKDGFYKTSKVQYWGFHAILGNEKMIKIVVVIKKTGDGKMIFWSVLPHRKFKNQKLYTNDMED